MTWIDFVGCLAALTVLATLCRDTIVPLRGLAGSARLERAVIFSAPVRRIFAPGLDAGLGPPLLGCNHADCFCAAGTGVFRATSRANLSALNRAVFSRVAKRAASYSAVAF